MANENIRKVAKVAQVPLWRVAEKLGMRDDAFSRMLRHELSEEEQKKCLAIINWIAKDCDRV